MAFKSVIDDIMLRNTPTLNIRPRHAWFSAGLLKFTRGFKTVHYVHDEKLKRVDLYFGDDYEYNAESPSCIMVPSDIRRAVAGDRDDIHRMALVMVSNEHWFFNYQ